MFSRSNGNHSLIKSFPSYLFVSENEVNLNSRSTLNINYYHLNIQIEFEGTFFPNQL